MTLRTPPRILTLFAALLALLTTSVAANAQTNATPPAEGESLPHLAFVNVGSCAEPGYIVFKLTDIPTAAVATATPIAGLAASPAAIGQTQSVTTVDSSLEELLADPHAINVRESVKAVDTYIACADISGTPKSGKLELALAEQNDSGISGSAMLSDNGDGTTDVRITLGAANGGATPEASPVS